MSRFLFSICPAVLCLCLACAQSIPADTLTISGIINQSTNDGTGPAVSNPSLNNILDGNAYTLDLSFSGSGSSPGTYDLNGSSLFLRVPVAGAVESAFDSVSLTITQSGVSDQISLFACLSTGSGCNQGNELGLSFMIPAASLNNQNVAALGIPNLLPFDLLEDDGVTDIQGSIANYSYTQTSPVPEPASCVFAALGLVAVALKSIQRHRR